MEWIYEEQVQSSKQAETRVDKAKEAAQASEIIPPSAEDVALLHDLSRKGLINDLLKEIERIEELDSKFVPFVHQLRELAKGFKLRQIKSFIEQYL